MQIYISICPTTADGVNRAASIIEECVSAVQNWMARNFLKLNAEKTEVIVILRPRKGLKLFGKVSKISESQKGLKNLGKVKTNYQKGLRNSAKV